LIGALALGACASDPNKDVQEAHEARVEQHNETAKEQAELNRKQSEDRAELQQEQRSEQAELRGDSGQDSAATSKSVSQAQAEMTQERRDFAADAEKRIQKADAKANELLNNSRNLSPAKKAKFDAAWTNYKTSRELAAEKAKGVYVVANPDWASSKTEIENSIKQLEDSVDNLNKVF
jgi:hypothetical protein